jgi:lipoprotein NlpD
LKSALTVTVVLLLVAACAAPGRAPVVERTAKSRAAARTAPKPPAPRPAPAVVAPAPQPAAEGYYIVRKGDTLYSIALENGADYRELAQWNGLDDPARIKVGQALRVVPPENRLVQIGRPTLAGPIESRPLEARPVAPAPAPEPVRMAETP